MIEMTNVLFTQNINDTLEHLRYLSSLGEELDYIEKDLNEINRNLRMSNLIELHGRGYLSHGEFKEIVDEYLLRDD